MKKITFTLLLSLVFFTTNAQEIIDVVTQEVCTCIETQKAKFSALPPDKLKVQLGLCMIGGYTAHKDKVMAAYGNVMENEEAMNKFGEDIGMKMITVCPETLMSIAGAADTSGEITSSAEVLSIEGKVTEIKNEQFTTILVKDKNGRVYSFIVLNYFDSASLIIGDELKKNASVAIKYSEVELYDNKAKEFRFYKVISGIEKK